jgi:hypothetical protein
LGSREGLFSITVQVLVAKAIQLIKEA